VPVSLDWINGRRTPYTNQNLKAVFSNLTLGSGAPEIFLSLIYAICFGSKKIIERFSEEGLKIKKVIGVGGIAKKSPFIMQTMANVLDIPISVCLSEQTPALGAAISASVASGIYKTIPEAIEVMGSDFEKVYQPEKNKVEKLKKMYLKYNKLSIVTENELK
jgi:L-ribulokinase